MSSKWTTRKVDQVPNTEAFANLPQLGSGGRKETAQQSIPAEPLHPLVPAPGVAIQPLEDPGQLGRDRGLSLANEPTGLVDQLGIASQWKALNHTLMIYSAGTAAAERGIAVHVFSLAVRVFSLFSLAAAEGGIAVRHSCFGPDRKSVV